MDELFRHKKNRRSMRSVVLWTVGTALLVFMILFYYIFMNNMFNMMEQNETDQIRSKSEIVASAVKASMLSTRALATDWASWDETYAFALGQNPGHFQKNWSESRRTHAQKYNFLVVKDMAGNDLFVKYSDYFEEETSLLPPGFSEFLSGLAEDVQKKFQQRRDYGIPGPEDRDGFIFHDEVAYYVCARPILMFSERSNPAGTMLFGRILNKQEIERITNAKNLTFTVLNDFDAEITNLNSEFAAQGSLIKIEEKITTFYMRLPSFLDSSKVVLKIEKNRDLYQRSLRIIKLSCAALGLIMICFIGALFYFLEKYVLRPIENISDEVRKVAVSSEIIDTDAYDDSQELCTLAWAINSMLERLRLNQEIAQHSTLSLNIVQNILDSLDTYLFVADLETDTVLFLNDKMKNHFQLKDDIIGRPCYEVIKPCTEKECVICARSELLANPAEPVVNEVKIDFTGRYYRKVDMIIDWVDQKKAHLLYFIDITELKQAEAALEKRLEQEKLMSAISQNFITKGDMEAFINNTLEMTGKFMNVSRIVLAKHEEKEQALELKYIWGGRETDTVTPGHKLPFRKNTPLYDELSGNDYAAVAYIGAVTSGRRYEHAKLMGAKAFLAVTLYVSGEFWGILEFDQCDDIYAWSGSDVHLSQLIGGVLSGALTNQSAETKLLHMSALIDSAPQYISYINPQGEYDFFNPATCELTGYSHDELMAGGMNILYDEKISRQIFEEILPKIDEHGKYEFELPLIRKNGESRIMAFSAFAIVTDKEKVGCIATDITEKKRLEQNLREAKETAEKASRAKSEFLSIMSHEMRTPMNAIIGMTSIGKSANTLEKKEYCLDKIDNASKHLLGVINDILDMSKIEADKFELSYGEFDLEKMLINATGMLSFRVEEKKQVLSVSFDKNIPRFIIGDEQRLSQVITNLMSNAVKFTPEEGIIKLKIETLAEKDGVYTLQFELEDSGIGISPENQKRLFKSFEQADRGIARQYGGTGLGLAISKRIVEMMDGEIWVESELGKGTKFIFNVKVKKGETLHKHLLNLTVNKDNLRIMAVDDSVDIREYFLNVMQNFNLPCDVAADGFEALEMIEKNINTPYNMFFIDWMMPQMNGIELTRQIRRLTNDNAIIFMISIAEWKEIEDEARQAGVDHFISKPLFPSLLIDVINQSMGTASPDEAAEKSDETHDFSGHTLLLAEDVEVNQEIIAAFLENTKLTVDFAENGLRALEMFKKSPGKYSLILMDVHMPEMDGYEATRSIRALDFPKAKSIPIIAMTANVFREDVENCLTSGMNDHIGKPVSVEQLFTKLGKYLGNKKKSKFKGVTDITNHKPAVSGAKQEPAPADEEDSGYEHFLPALNVKDGLMRVMNNKNLYFSLLKSFKIKEMTDELVQNIKAADFTKTKQTAHAIKGASLNLGFVQLAGMAREIEAQADLKVKGEQLIFPLQEAVDAAVASINALLESEGTK